MYAISTQFERVQKEWIAYVVGLAYVVVILCVTSVLMAYMTGAISISANTGDMTFTSGNLFTANKANSGGMFR